MVAGGAIGGSGDSVGGGGGVSGRRVRVVAPVSVPSAGFVPSAGSDAGGGDGRVGRKGGGVSWRRA